MRALFGLFLLTHVLGDSLVEQFARGFDWTSGLASEFLYDVQSLSHLQGKQLKLFNQSFAIPDLLESQATPEATIQSALHIIANSSDFVNAYGGAHVFALGLPILPIGFASSKIKAAVDVALNSSNQIVYLNIAQVSFFALAMWPPEVSGLVLPELSSLDVNDEKAARAVFEKYGTHYNAKSNFGVELVYVISLDAGVVAKLGLDSVHTQMGMYLHFLDFRVGLHTGYNYNEVWGELDPSFRAGVHLTVFLNGDEVDPMQLSAELLNQISTTTPFPARTDRRPITDFFYSLADADQIANLTQQWRNYMTSPPPPPALSTSPSVSLLSLDSPNAAAYGNPPIAGADYVGALYDAASMQSTVLRVAPNTYWLPRTWQPDPADPDSSSVVQVPDAMTVAATDEGCSMSGVDMMDSEEDMVNTLSSKSFHFWGLGFSSRADYDFKQHYFASNQSLLLNTTCNSLYQLAVFPPYQQTDLDPRFVKMVNQLPTAYSSDPVSPAFQSYQRFLSFVGTHYITRATMGATSKAVLWFHRCFLSVEDTDWVQKMSGWSFLGLINDFSGSIHTNTSLDQAWDDYTDYYAELSGGNPLLFPLSQDQGQAWADSIKDHLVAIDNEVESISSLVTWDTQRQSNIDAAVADYMDMAVKTSTLVSQSLIPREPVPPPAWCQ